MRAGDHPREGHFCPNCGYNRAPDPVVEMGGWRVDPRIMEATYGGGRVHFTRSEFIFFHSVLSARGDIVSRDVLRERIGTEADGNVIDVWTRRVRAKIAGTPLNILTVRGHGLRAVEKRPRMITLKSNKIPVRQDGAETPPALGVENSSRVALRAPRLPTSTGGSRGNLNNTVGRRRLIVAETYHELPDDLADQPGLIALVGVNGTVEPFHFIDFRSFHGAASSQREQEDNARRY